MIQQVILGDCLQKMADIKDKSIDLTITSPPYDNLRTYNNSLNWNIEIFQNIANELYRITKIGGVLVWIVSDGVENGGETLNSFRQALYFQSIGLIMHDTMIYRKNSYPFPPSNRYYQQFEYMFVLSNGKPKTTNILRCPSQGRKRNSTHRQQDGTTKKTEYKTGHSTRIRDNIWDIDTGYMRTTKDKLAYKHPAMFPEELAKDHILSWSNENDIVLDPMAGSGTVGKMAKLLNRQFILIEKEEKYYNIILERLKTS